MLFSCLLTYIFSTRTVVTAALFLRLIIFSTKLQGGLQSLFYNYAYMQNHSYVQELSLKSFKVAVIGVSYCDTVIPICKYNSDSWIFVHCCQYKFILGFYDLFFWLLNVGYFLLQKRLSYLPNTVDWIISMQIIDCWDCLLLDGNVLSQMVFTSLDHVAQS